MDYDSPKALLDDRRSRADDYDTPTAKSQVNSPSNSFTNHRFSNNSNKSSESEKSQSKLLNESSFSKLFSTFQKSQKDTDVHATQVVQMIGRWSKCQNSGKLQIVIKTMCVNLWKHLQDYLAESSKMFAFLKTLATPEVVASVKNTKTSSRDMEDVLEKFSRQSLDQDNFVKTLSQLSNILVPLLENMKFIGAFYEMVDRQNLWSSVNEEGNTKSNKYQSNLSCCSVDYDLPRKSKIDILNDASKDYSQQSNQRVQSSDLTSQMNKLRLEKSEFTDYDRPKSIENLDLPRATDYDMPRNSVDELSIKQDFSYRPKSLDNLDYDSPVSSRMMANPLVNGVKTSSDQSRATSDYISNPDYDIPPPDNTRKSMEQLLTLVNHRGFKENLNSSSNMPPKPPTSESRVDSSIGSADYDYPAASSSDVEKTDINNNTKPMGYVSPNSVNQWNSTNASPYDLLPKSAAERSAVKIKQRTQPNFEKSEISLLKYYKPHLLSQLQLISEHMKQMNNQLNNSKLNGKSLTQQVRFLAISTHKFVFIIDFITRNLSNHTLFCRELNSICNKIVDYLKSIASCTKQCSEQNANTSSQKILHWLGDLEATLKNSGEVIEAWQC